MDGKGLHQSPITYPASFSFMTNTLCLIPTPHNPFTPTYAISYDLCVEKITVMNDSTTHHRHKELLCHSTQFDIFC